MLAKHTLTRSASERGLEWISVFKSSATKSITGNGSKKAVADISEKAEKVENVSGSRMYLLTRTVSIGDVMLIESCSQN